MRTTIQRRNQFDMAVDANGIPYIEVLVEHGEGEIWAKIRGLSRFAPRSPYTTGTMKLTLRAMS